MAAAGVARGALKQGALVLLGIVTTLLFLSTKASGKLEGGQAAGRLVLCTVAPALNQLVAPTVSSLHPLARPPRPQDFLNLHYALPGGLLVIDPSDPALSISAPLFSRAAKCALAGGILCCIFNSLASLAIGE